MYVFICEDSLEGIFTGVYEAGSVTAISGLPPANRRITSFFLNIFTWLLPRIRPAR